MLAIKLSFLLLVLASANVAIVAGSSLPWFLPGPCDSDPCKNGGKCTVVPFSYTCTCADGWKGSVCTVKVSCPIVLEKKGCFKEDQKPPRLLPNYILTDRDSSLKIYSGQGVDWGNWINYLPDFVCRCAQLAKSKNFKFFGIQYYGECWSGPSQDESSFKEDRNSTECVNTDWKECSDQSKFACAGKQFNNYIYAIVSYRIFVNCCMLTALHVTSYAILEQETLCGVC